MKRTKRTVRISVAEVLAKRMRKMEVAGISKEVIKVNHNSLRNIGLGF
jgi:hypothetical protein